MCPAWAIPLFRREVGRLFIAVSRCLDTFDGVSWRPSAGHCLLVALEAIFVLFSSSWRLPGMPYWSDWRGYFGPQAGAVRFALSRTTIS